MSSAQRRTLLLAPLATLLVLVAFVTPLATAGRTAVDLGSRPTTVPWLLSAMALGLAVALLPSGALADDVGRRRVFVAGLLVVALGSAVCSAAAGSGVFVAGRLLTGLGGGAVLACALGLVGHAFPPGPARAHAAGVWGASVGAGIATGGLLAVAVDHGSSWRHAYVVLAVLAVGVGVAGHSLLDESTSGARRGPDLLGTVLLGTGLALLLSGLVQAGRGRLSAEAVVLLAGGALLVGLFAVAETRVAAPLLDPALLRRRPFLAASLGAFANGAGITAVAAFTPTLVQRGLGGTLLAASLVTLLFAGTSVVAALLVRRLPLHVPGRTLVVAGLLGGAVGQLMQTGLSTSSSVLRLLPGCVVAGVAFGVLNAALGREAVASVPPDRTAMGSGANNTARYVGSALGITVVSVVATRSPGPGGLVDGWDHAVLLAAAVSVLGAVGVALLRPVATEGSGPVVAAPVPGGVGAEPAGRSTGVEVRA
ncbi:MAG: Transrane efflux protein [Frankiales bacterium]|nr:Transrane efflux protein [Frankiales bacterium]